MRTRCGPIGARAGQTRPSCPSRIRPNRALVRPNDLRAASGNRTPDFALRACRVRDGGRWSERSSAGSLLRSRRLARLATVGVGSAGARRGHGIAAAAFDARLARETGSDLMYALNLGTRGVQEALDV